MTHRRTSMAGQDAKRVQSGQHDATTKEVGHAMVRQWKGGVAIGSWLGVAQRAVGGAWVGTLAIRVRPAVGRHPQIGE